MAQRYPELFQLKLPSGANEALTALAELQHQSRSESLRQLIFRELRSNGIPVVAADHDEPEVLQA